MSHHITTVYINSVIKICWTSFGHVENKCDPAVRKSEEYKDNVDTVVSI